MANFSIYFADSTNRYTFPAVQTFPLGADGVPSTERMPGQHGGFDQYHDLEMPAAVGNINFTFMLYARSRDDMHAKREAVDALKRLGTQKLYYQPQGSASARWCYAKVNNIRHQHRPAEHTDLMQSVSISFQVADPFWRGDEASDARACSGTSTDNTVAVNGNAPALARVEIVCGVGQTAENPIVRVMSGSDILHELSYVGVLVEADELVLDAMSKQVLLNGANAYQGGPNITPDWFVLLPGNNTVRTILANAGDACTCTVYWNSTFYLG